MEGDDLHAVAQRAGVSPAMLAAKNNLEAQEVAEGMYLLIP